MDDTFISCYKEFTDEVQGIQHMYVNDRVGFEKAIKDATYRLCVDYHKSIPIAQQNLSCSEAKASTPKSCRRSGDCAFERVEGKCMGETCGVYDPA